MKRSGDWRRPSQIVDTWLGAAPPQPTQQRLFYRGERTRPNQIFGTTERFVDVNFAKMFAGRIFTEQEVIRRRNVAVIGYGPYQALFAKRNIDPIGKVVRIGAVEYTIVGVIDKRPAAGGFSLGQDDFAIIPYTAYRKQFGSETRRAPGRSAAPAAMIADRARTSRRPAKTRCARSRASCASGTG